MEAGLRTFILIRIRFLMYYVSGHSPVRTGSGYSLYPRLQRGMPLLSLMRAQRNYVGTNNNSIEDCEYRLYENCPLEGTLGV